MVRSYLSLITLYQIYPLPNLSFASDYSFVRNGKNCLPVGPEPILAGVCTGNQGKLFVIVELRRF